MWDKRELFQKKRILQDLRFLHFSQTFLNVAQKRRKEQGLFLISTSFLNPEGTVELISFIF